MVFESAMLKLARGYEHLVGLNAEINTFMLSEPVPYELDVDRDADWFVATLKVVRDPPPRLSLIAGDSAQNMRAALDHLVFELSATRPRGVAFPISIDQSEYFGSGKAGKVAYRDRCLAGVPDEARVLIDSVQPLHAGDAASIQPLAMLSRFTNDDKHHVVHPRFMRMHRVRLRAPDPYRPALLQRTFFGDGVTPGSELFRFKLEPTPPEHVASLPVEIRVDLTVGFGTWGLDNFDLTDMYVTVRTIIGAFFDGSSSIVLPPRTVRPRPDDSAQPAGLVDDAPSAP